MDIATHLKKTESNYKYEKNIDIFIFVDRESKNRIYINKKLFILIKI